MSKGNAGDLADIVAAREQADCLVDARSVERAVDQLAVRLALRLDGAHPIVMCVMNGGIVLTAELLLRLQFPLEFSYVHATRYHGTTAGGALTWRVEPGAEVAGRTILLVDDVFDAGTTLTTVASRLTQMGAARVITAVLVDKAVRREEGLQLDEAAVQCPDRYLFGHGMDYRGHWRNLAGIYALAGAERKS